MGPLNKTPADAQNFSLDMRGLEGLKKGARADRGSEEYDAAIDKVAVQFESILLQMALKSMRDATPEGGLFTDSSTKSYQAMYDQELVQKLSGKGLGLAGEIAKQLRAQSQASAIPLGDQNASPSTLPGTDR